MWLLRRQTMIATAYKAKISHTLSYPLGAGEISEFAGEFPQLDRTSIRFVSQHGIWASHWNKMLREGTPYNVLECIHKCIDDRPLYGSSDNIVWTIRVYPVLRSLRSHAHEGLLNQALPLLHKWLVGTSTDAGRRRVSSLMWFQFDPIEKSVSRR